ncbi:hypothetical protein [Paractinoplanes toevensis]|uniref:Uncharacterized protein n=1 Tax=Paractinoplanes toevensis TaxID=571911 RepID=A0A919W1U1_9ACTN|nr:hypothetical protein [Actinoplanes toevensis]GIM88805.1 hypothetical protein Ato02nite_005980 [Actinoplanes toevensis]
MSNQQVRTAVSDSLFGTATAFLTAEVFDQIVTDVIQASDKGVPAIVAALDEAEVFAAYDTEWLAAHLDREIRKVAL